MQKEFWLGRWEREEIGFHEGTVNTYLNQYWKELNVVPGDKVFVPLCGKSVDMRWLRERDHKVIGVEFSKIAAQAFFQENDLVPKYISSEKFDCYEANDIRIFCGDLFNLKRADLAGVKAVYDRASMVALPPEMRERYVDHLVNILNPGVKILLVTFDYPQNEMEGPAFAVSSAEVIELYSRHAEVRLLARVDVLSQNPRFQKKGLTSLHEGIYLLTLL